MSAEREQARGLWTPKQFEKGSTSEVETITRITRSSVRRPFLDGATGGREAVGLLEHAVRKFADAVTRLKEADPDAKVTSLTAGNPPLFGIQPAQFAQEILKSRLPESNGYAYSLGERTAREKLAALHTIWTPEAEEISPDHMLVTNGVAHAIGMVVELLHALYNKTIVIPKPSYPSFEAIAGLHLKGKPPSYNLDQKKDWEIDLASLEEQLEEDPRIAAVLLIHPNNPTGKLYSPETLRAVAELAGKHGKMMVCDEIYFQLIRSRHRFQHIIPIAEQAEVPLLVLRGGSKDVPAPGHRFGWVQAHGIQHQPEFGHFWKALQGRMKAEVAAGTLPQVAIPEIYTDPRFAKEWLPAYNSELETIVDDLAGILKTAPDVEVTSPEGGFYITVSFKEGALRPGQQLPLIHGNDAFQNILKSHLELPGLPLDEHFVWSVIGAEGIAAIPSSGFSGPPGFRITGLIRDPKKRREIGHALVRAITEYLRSA